MKQTFIPLSEPYLHGREWQYVKDCLDTGWVSSVGSYVERFERCVAAYADRTYAVATCTGTAALHTALMACGVTQDEEVIMPALTFAAPAFAARYAGAWPVFMDADPDYWQMDVEKTAQFINKECRSVRGKLINRRTGRRIRAVIPVHLLGHSVDMAPLMALARHHGLTVIEDVAESIGSTYKGRKTGHFGDMACFSFNGNKIITCGGGGMLVTNDRKIAEKARHLTTQAKKDPIEYVHDAIGYNYRLTNVQAAIGVAQMEKLEDFVGRKRAIAGRYAKALSGQPGLVLPKEAPYGESIFWLYTVLVDAKCYGIASRRLMERLSKASIQSRPLWRPLHLQKIFAGCDSYAITHANRLYQEALSLPSSSQLTLGQQNKIIEALM